GLECLSGIPGLAGATPIQNVGAYGQEVSETITAVRVLERDSLLNVTLAPADCGFGYRTSAFKRDPDRFVVLGVRFALRRGAPRDPAADGAVKLAAGWLIERAGVARGLRRGAVGVSSAHALALVHHGGGTTAELLALAREVRDAVAARFGVHLVPEPTLVGAS